MTVAMSTTGRAWVVGDNIPSDQMVKSHRVFLPMAEIAKYVMEDANPAFAPGVSPGDVLIAGRHFGQSSGRAIATKAVQATGVGCVVAESFARTFYRNAFEVGLPILEVPDIRAHVTEGDQVTVDVAAGTIHNERTGETIHGNPTHPFLIEMLEGGGLIPIAAKLVGDQS
jgi:3-isopropylmalate/(R)-2-methylmalate dehydratase small subunit